MNELLRTKAISLGASDFGVSRAKNKKYYVIYKGKRINFGDRRYEDYTSHRDNKRKESYHKRHKAIKLKDGSLAYKNKNKASFWSMRILWE